MKKLIIIFILTLIPLYNSFGHEDETHFNIDPGVLPGEIGYTVERITEWISLNLLTVSTRAKQQGKLKLADERLAEIIQLIVLNKSEKLELPIQRYQTFLVSSGDMVKKIIFLDGSRKSLGYDFEYQTRVHETVLADVLKNLPQNKRDNIIKLISLVRIENEDIFNYLVLNYQASNQDIEKNKTIFQYHINLVEKQLFGGKIETSKAKQINDLLIESRKHKLAGLTLQGYKYINKAKSIIYSGIVTDQSSQ